MSFYQGVLYNLCGSISVNGGTNLMKKGTMDKQKNIWYLGTFLFAIGNVLNFMSFSMAPQSFLASLSAVQFVSNVFFASCLLGEVITRRVIGATALIIVGVLVAVSQASHTDRHFSILDLYNFYRGVYSLYLLGQLILFIVCSHLYRSAPAGAAYAPVCFAAASAMVGTQAVVQAKCVSEILLHRKTFGYNPGALWWFPIAVLVLLIFSQVFWLVRMQLALTLFSGAVIIPCLQVFWTSFSILTGGLYFNEFENFGWERSSIMFIGLCILYVGVYFLVPQAASEPLAQHATPEERARHTARCTKRASAFCGAGLLDLHALAKDEDEEESNEVVPRLARRMTARLSFVGGRLSDRSSFAHHGREALGAGGALELPGIASAELDAEKAMQGMSMVQEGTEPAQTPHSSQHSNVHF